MKDLNLKRSMGEKIFKDQILIEAKSLIQSKNSHNSKYTITMHLKDKINEINLDIYKCK